jgi:hypothetical protein
MRDTMARNNLLGVMAGLLVFGIWTFYPVIGWQLAAAYTVGLMAGITIALSSNANHPVKKKQRLFHAHGIARASTG